MLFRLACVLFLSSLGVQGDPCGTGMQLFANLTCAPCTNNTFCPYPSGCSPTCLTCPDGTTLDLNSNRSQCVSGVCNACPAGGWCPSGLTFTPCTNGTFNNKTGMLDSSACTQCQAGYFSQQGQTVCVACSPGSFSDQGAAVCSQCLAGSYSNQNAAATCTGCMAGSMSSDGSSFCAMCPAGSISAAASSTCTSCLAGYYSNPTLTACVGCQPGYFSNAVGASLNSTCAPCAMGLYGNQPQGASTGCVACPLNTYQPSMAAPNSSSCRNCTANSITMSNGAQQQAQCICDYSYYGQLGLSCTPCNPGSYADSRNMSRCTLCGNNTVDMNAPIYWRNNPSICTSIDLLLAVMTVPSGSTCANISCNPGYYRVGFECSTLPGVMDGICHACYIDTPNSFSLAGSTACTPCVNAVTSNQSLSTTPAQCSCNSGYFKSDSSSSTCQVCPQNQVCAGAYAQPVGCPSNSHFNGSGAASNTSCMCDAGYFKVYLQ